MIEINLPESLLDIYSYAFYQCYALNNVVLPFNLKTIGNSAFNECVKFTEIVIPKSVTTIGEYAFSNCSKLSIYCEVSSKPKDWSNNWADGVKEVQYGYKEN